MTRLKNSKIVILAGAALVALLVVEAALYYRLDAKRSTLARQDAVLRDMREMAGEWRSIHDRAARVVLPDGKSLDPVEINALAKVHGIAQGISSTRSAESNLGEGLGRQKVDIEIKAVTREDLARFLNSVEKLAPGIWTSELGIRPNSEQGGLVNAHIQFSAYVKNAPGA